MVRFVDLGKQLGITKEWPRQFAFFDTVNDRFIQLNQSQVWDDWEQFRYDLESDQSRIGDLGRFRSLCQGWVFESTEAGQSPGHQQDPTKEDS